jgi:hypothetical protein
VADSVSKGEIALAEQAAARGAPTAALMAASWRGVLEVQFSKPYYTRLLVGDRGLLTSAVSVHERAGWRSTRTAVLGWLPVSLGC